MNECALGYRELSEFCCITNTNYAFHEASPLVIHSNVQRSFKPQTTQSFANVCYLPTSVYLKVGHHQATQATQTHVHCICLDPCRRST